jgi:hypothetical protein
VYLANPAQNGQFIEREVRLGASAGDHVSVLSGVTPGDLVVSEGSFAVRAERERLGLRPTVTPAAGAAAQPPPQSGQAATIHVSDAGYEPARVELRAGVPARLTFVRMTDKTCGTEIVFPSLNIRRALPLHAPVVIDLTPSRDTEVAFTCGMNMLKGAIVIVEQ